jgi:hypothetical protein
VYATTGNTGLTVQATLKGVLRSTIFTIPTPQQNTWVAVTIPLTTLGVANSPFFDGFQIKVRARARMCVCVCVCVCVCECVCEHACFQATLTSLSFRQLTTAATTFYLDDITLVGLPIPTSTTVSVNAASSVRTVDSRTFGVNTAVWDPFLPPSAPVIAEAGFTTLRFPGGSTSDDVRAAKW